MLRLRRLSILTFCIALAGRASGAGTIFVDASASGANDGTSWTHAFTDLHDGLALAAAGDEVWVAAGTYRPGAGGDATLSFRIKSSVAVYGGFEGNEATRSERDPSRHLTTLDGSFPGGRSHHVVRSSGTVGAVLDGFTVTGGYAAADANDVGGGMVGSGGTLVRSCRFVGNEAAYHGGAVAFGGTFIGCDFVDNSAGYGGWGGGVYAGVALYDCSFEGNRAWLGGGAFVPGGYFQGCTFSDNHASGYLGGEPIGAGGAIWTHGGTVVSSIFEDNDANDVGGAISLEGEGNLIVGSVFTSNAAVHGGAIDIFSGTISSCAVSGNAATGSGGGLHVYDEGEVTVSGSTFTGNTAGSGGAIRAASSVVSVTDCILWGDAPEEIRDIGGSFVVDHSDIQGGWPGSGNLDVDPLFVDAAAGDLRLAAGSPCIDSGDNLGAGADLADLDGDGDVSEPLPFDVAWRARFMDDPAAPDTGSGLPPLVDMGAHERAQVAAANVLVGPGRVQPNPDRVRLYTAAGFPTTVDFFAYGAGHWGVNVASGDLDAGSTSELLTGPGPGPIYGPTVRAFRRDGSPIAKVTFFAYSTLRFGVNDTGARLDADVYDEILTGAGPGAVFGPHVRGWQFDATAVTAIAKLSFFAYATLRYGVNTGRGDVDGDDDDEVLSGPGPGDVFAPLVRGFAFDGASVTAIGSLNFWAFSEPRFGCATVGGDVDGDLHDEIAVSPGPGGSTSFPAQFRGFDHDGVGVSAIPGYDVSPFPGSRYGGRPGMGDLDANGRDDLLASSGPDPSSDSTVLGFSHDGVALAGVGRPFRAFEPLAHGAGAAGALTGY